MMESTGPTPTAPTLPPWLQAAGVNLIRFEVHFNVEGTGFDGMRPDGISSKVTSTVVKSLVQ